MENIYDDPARVYNATDDCSRVEHQPVHKRRDLQARPSMIRPGLRRLLSVTQGSTQYCAVRRADKVMRRGSSEIVPHSPGQFIWYFFFFLVVVILPNKHKVWMKFRGRRSERDTYPGGLPRVLTFAAPELSFLGVICGRVALYKYKPKYYSVRCTVTHHPPCAT